MYALLITTIGCATIASTAISVWAFTTWHDRRH